MDGITQDLRHALRFVRSSPGFAALVALTLGLGIGANAAIFGLLDQILVQSLPVKDPERLVMLSGPGTNSGMFWNTSEVLHPFSHPMFEDIRDRNEVFDGVLARAPMSFYLGRGAAAEPVEGSLVSGGYFQVLGVGAAMGRVFTADDDRTPGAHPLAVLSHGCWQRRFGSDPSVLGQSITLNGQPLTIIGVAASGFQGVEIGRSAEVFVPMMMKPLLTPLWNGLGERRVIWLQIMARLRPGLTIETARPSLDVLYRQILEAEAAEITGPPPTFMKEFVEKKLELSSGAQGAPELQNRLRTPLLVLMGMVGLVVLIACANVANLLLTRATGRRKEIALRLALGATRARLVRQLFAESLLLSLLGALAGLFFSTWTAGLLIQSLPSTQAAMSLSADPDWRVILFALALAFCTAVLVGLAPALQSTRPDLVTALKEQTGASSGGPGPLRLRKGLVVAQVALSALLLMGAGLFARSLAELRAFDPGFRHTGLLSFSADPVTAGRPPADNAALFGRIRERLLSLPGVEAVTMSSEGLMINSYSQMSTTVEGYTPAEGVDERAPLVTPVGPTFVATLGLPLLAGRDLSPGDDSGAPKVAVVNEAFARHYFGGASPIGRRFRFSRETSFDREIVGLVQDARLQNLRETVRPSIWMPYLQSRDVEGLAFYVRVAGDPLRQAEAVRKAVAEVDPELPLAELTTLTATIDESLRVDRMIAVLSAAFGLLATILAGVGLYGVMSYTVARRTREIGVRVALGADQRRILRLVLADVGALFLAGIAIGLPGGWGLGRLVESQLFGLAPFDPPSVAGAVLTLALATVLAGTLPSLRALRIEPSAALRHE